VQLIGRHIQQIRPDTPIQPYHTHGCLTNNRQQVAQRLNRRTAGFYIETIQISAAALRTKNVDHVNYDQSRSLQIKSYRLGMRLHGYRLRGNTFGRHVNMVFCDQPPLSTGTQRTRAFRVFGVASSLIFNPPLFSILGFIRLFFERSLAP